MASKNLKGIIVEIGGNTSDLTESLRDVDSELSNLQSNLRTVNSALKLDPGNVEALTQKQALLNSAVESTTSRLETLRAAQRTLDRQIADGVDVDQRAYRNLQSEIVRAEASLNDYTRQANAAGDESSDAAEKTADGWSIAKDIISDLGSQAIQAVIEAFKDLLFEGEKALDMLQAKVGASDKAMQKYGDVAKNVFKRGWGQSLADVTDSIATITNMLGDLDEVELEKVTENAMTLSDVFGWDVKESVRAANSLMDKFGLTSDEAFNLLIQGARKGVDQNGDLLDIVNEYSVQFRDAGYSADDMFNMLANGAAEGTWSVDKLGDAIKEMNIRMSDGTVADAVLKNRDALKLTEKQAEELSESLRSGGEDGKKAMNTILESILKVENPTERYKLGVSAFGTMWEDLGETAITALLNTEGGIKSVNDAMSQVKTDAYDNLSKSFSELGRTLKTEILDPIVEDISPVLKNGIKWVIENIEPLKPAIIGVSVAIGVITAAIVAAKVATIALTAAMSVNPIFLAATLITAGIMGVISAITSLTKAADTSGKAIKANAEAVTAFTDAIDNAKPSVIDAKNALSAYGRTFAEIDTLMSESEESITTILATALAEQRKLRDDELASIAEYNEKLKALQEEKLNTYRQAMTVEIMKITSEAQTMSQEQAAQYLVNMQEALDQANEISTERYNAQLGQIYNFHQAQGTLMTDAYTAEVERAKLAYEQELADSKAFYEEGLANLQSHANQWILTDHQKWVKVIENIDEGKKEYKDALAQINLDNANAFLSMYLTTVRTGGEISEEAHIVAEGVLGAFSGLPKGMQEAGKDALLGVIKGLGEEIPGLEDASEMTASEIIAVLKKELQINSPSRVTQGIGADTAAGLQVGMQSKQSLISTTASGIAGIIAKAFGSKNRDMAGIGANMVEGVESGIQSKQTWIGKKITTFAGGLVSAFKQAFDIRSPSHIMRDQIGAMLAEGIGEGIEENADAAIDPLNELKDELTAFDGVRVKGSLSRGATSSQHMLTELINEMRDVHAVLSEHLPHLKKKVGVYVNGKRLVGELIEDIDEGLGEIANRKAVGAT